MIVFNVDLTFEYRLAAKAAHSSNNREYPSSFVNGQSFANDWRRCNLSRILLSSAEQSDRYSTGSRCFRIDHRNLGVLSVLIEWNLSRTLLSRFGWLWLQWNLPGVVSRVPIPTELFWIGIPADSRTFVGRYSARCVRKWRRLNHHGPAQAPPDQKERISTDAIQKVETDDQFLPVVSRREDNIQRLIQHDSFLTALRRLQKNYPLALKIDIRQEMVPTDTSHPIPFSSKRLVCVSSHPPYPSTFCRKYHPSASP